MALSEALLVGAVGLAHASDRGHDASISTPALHLTGALHPSNSARGLSLPLTSFVMMAHNRHFGTDYRNAETDVIGELYTKRTFCSSPIALQQARLKGVF